MLRSCLAAFALLATSLAQVQLDCQNQVPALNTLTSTCAGQCGPSTGGPGSCVVLGKEDSPSKCSNSVVGMCNSVGECTIACLPQPTTASIWAFRIGVTNRQDLDVARVQTIEGLSILPSISTLRIRPRDTVTTPTDKLNLTKASFDNSTNVTNIDIEGILVSNLHTISIYPRLTSLRLSNIGLADPMELDPMQMLQNIESLDLSFNKLTLLPTYLFSYKHLKSLNVANNSLADIHLSSANFAMLKSIAFTATSVVVTGPCKDATYQPISLTASMTFCVSGDSNATTPPMTTPMDPALAFTTHAPSSSAGQAPSSKSLFVLVGAVVCVVLGLVIYFALFYRTKSAKSKANMNDDDGRLVATDDNDDDAGGGRTSHTSRADSSLHVMDASPTDKAYHAVHTVRLPSDPNLLATPPRDGDSLSTRSTWTIMSFRSMFTEIVYPELTVTHAPILLAHPKFDMVLGKYKGKKVLVNRLAPAAHDKSFLFLSLLSTLRHPRLLSVVGVTWCDVDATTGGIQMDVVCEPMDGVLLETHLRAARHVDTWANGKLQHVLDVALGLVHLHDHGYVYDGLSTRTLLVDAAHGVKFHTVAVAHKVPFACSPTALHVAPEVRAGAATPSESTDMFAFGVVLALIDASGAPYDSMDDIAFSSACPSVIAQVARSCLDVDPRQRPSASFAYAMIRKEGSFIAAA
ncbi:Aste57867_4413 [Aphanomyces stellatus]|uniref:Aste57867_4413 protein n=1 Tax=Aphanomyces stellatus TaxID=120398 RepID=A0A485KFV5_9STRA|nr:hypothetical protein As57867_004401 [Aphanomyces stellatus]VFT81524.1 Aste57867_4413 [Aphanomyces stellatus]